MKKKIIWNFHPNLGSAACYTIHYIHGACKAGGLIVRNVLNGTSFIFRGRNSPSARLGPEKLNFSPNTFRAVKHVKLSHVGPSSAQSLIMRRRDHTAQPIIPQNHKTHKLGKSLQAFTPSLTCLTNQQIRSVYVLSCWFPKVDSCCWWSGVAAVAVWSNN